MNLNVGCWSTDWGIYAKLCFVEWMHCIIYTPGDEWTLVGLELEEACKVIFADDRCVHL